jgi:acyl homoserine lactone synthase
MIECFDFATAHHFGNALAEQFRLRHRVFVQRTSYDVPSWREMEYDQYYSV